MDPCTLKMCAFFCEYVILQFLEKKKKIEREMVSGKLVFCQPLSSLCSVCFELADPTLFPEAPPPAGLLSPWPGLLGFQAAKVSEPPRSALLPYLRSCFLSVVLRCSQGPK